MTLFLDLPCVVPMETLRELLSLCTSNMQFFFNGKYYPQIDGVGMGSCLGLAFANIFVGYLEVNMASVIKENCTRHTHYIDDIFVTQRNS